jgi:uroporphyrinogen-III synthase
MGYKKHLARQLRKEQTEAEKKLWGHLRNRQFQNLKFRRQHPLKDYIVDFFCEEYGIVIELDGEYHDEINQKKKDELRDLQHRNLGFAVLRFENDLVFKKTDQIFETISAAKMKQQNFAEQRIIQLEKRRKNRGEHLTPTLSSRRGSSTILSTKILSPSQKSLVLNAGLQFVEYNAITIKNLDFELPKSAFDALIFTSQNGVKAYMEQIKRLHSPAAEGFGVRDVFCVGEKTKALLEENGFEVIRMASNGEQLGNLIISEYGHLSFLLVAGNRRREELPKILNQHHVEFKEVTAYETLLNQKSFRRNFDGILFFSPSGVASFFKKNKIAGTAFCIGETTAQEVKKHTDNFIVANKTTIENVLVQAVKYFNSGNQTKNK